jgi:hypothetical protein
MAVPIALAPVGGSAAELAPFALQSYYDTQLNLRRSGVPQHQAEIVGLVNAGLTAATMKLAFMPSRLMRSQIENAGIGELMDAFAGKSSIKDGILNYISKFAPTTTDAKNAFMAWGSKCP